MQKILLLSSLLFFVNAAISQSVGLGTTLPSDKAILDITSTDKGILVPRMTTSQRNLITGLGGGHKGLFIYNTDINRLQHWDGTLWTDVGVQDNLGNHTATGTLNMSDQSITNILGAFNNGWYRNNFANYGLYNHGTGRYFYSESSAYWAVASGNGMIFRNNYGGTITGYVYSDGSGSFGLLSPSGTWRVKVDNSNVEIFGGLYTGNSYIPIIYDRDNTGYFLDPNNGSIVNVFTANESYVNSWFRVNASGGIFWQAYGGGWNMIDATWLRTYNDKSILATGGIAGYSNGAFGTPLGMNPQIYANYNNLAGGGISISDDGGFADYNDGWVQFRGSTGLQIRTNNTSWAMLVNTGDVNGNGNTDKQISPSTNLFGRVGNPGNAWYEMHSVSYINPSERHFKKDITKVEGGVRDLVMKDLDKLHPYLYRYNVETDEMQEGLESKYRPGVHMGLIVDEAPDYIQASSFDGINIYAAATLSIAAAKHNRDEIREIKQAIGMNENSITIQDLGSKKTIGRELFVEFDADFVKALNGNLPVVTISTSIKGADLTVEDKSEKGFKVVVNGGATDVLFDYIAMAKVKLPEQRKEVVSTEIVNRMYVDESVKTKVKAYWKKQSEELKKQEEKSRQESILFQQKRQTEVK